MSDTITLKKQSAANNPSTGSATVSVASKLPWSLVLQLYEFRKESEQVHGMYREYQKAYPKQGVPTFTITGNAYNKHMGDNGKHISNGFAITTGIPRDFWEQWFEQNKEADYIKNGLIFAHGELAGLKAETTEKSAIKTGLERLDKDNLPKINGRKLETANINGA